MAKDFLDLPYEIRCEIYSYLLVSDKTIKLNWHLFDYKLALSTNILRTCSTISLEARSFLYGKNHYSVTWSPWASLVKIFLDKIGKTNTSFLKQIHIEMIALSAITSTDIPAGWFDRDVGDIKAIIELCPGLKMIEIQLGGMDNLRPKGLESKHQFYLDLKPSKPPTNNV
ncbi:hypothetical protein N7456_000677 [Penicillium angulare]|uniref:F-box domain-containing protein n=1 Tax=Penicillium angulare TaxID=116970 RepID=A0A9W9KSG6_9EURO|nr:hypothetical protein N7456_000677 [Penicillium angulare]